MPPTPDSILLRNLRKTEQIFQVGENSRIKFIEISGVKYKDYFKSTDPLYANCITIDDCFLCKDRQQDQIVLAPPQCDLRQAQTVYNNQYGEKIATSISHSDKNQRSTGPSTFEANILPNK